MLFGCFLLDESLERSWFSLLFVGFTVLSSRKPNKREDVLFTDAIPTNRSSTGSSVACAASELNPSIVRIYTLQEWMSQNSRQSGAVTGLGFAWPYASSRTGIRTTQGSWLLSLFHTKKTCGTRKRHNAQKLASPGVIYCWPDHIRSHLFGVFIYDFKI